MIMFRDKKGKICQVNLHPAEGQVAQGLVAQDVEIDFVQDQREAKGFLTKNGLSVQSAVLTLVKW